MNVTKNSVILQTDLPGIERHAQGKVRDVYSVDENRLLIVASDRLSGTMPIAPCETVDKKLAYGSLNLNATV